MAERADFRLTDPDAATALGRALGGLVQPGDVIGLVGDLGAGKTHLTRAIAEGIGIRDTVTSPTFALIHEYRGPIPLFHVDPYRLQHAEGLWDLGFEEYLERGGVTIVEWANLMEALLPPQRLILALTLAGEDEPMLRTLHAEARGARYERLLDSLLALPEIAPLQEPQRGNGMEPSSEE